MVNPLIHWLQIPFGNIFQIPLRGISGFKDPPGLVVPEKSGLNVILKSISLEKPKLNK